jgi:hypothetical protein
MSIFQKELDAKRNLPEQGKNYMEYTQSLSYDDQQYDMYADSNYGVYSPQMTKDVSIIENPRKESLQPIQPPLPSSIKSQIDKDSNKSIISNTHQSISKRNSSLYACPVCDNIAISVCSCQYRDAECQNSHYWYIKDGIKHVGNSPFHTVKSH